MVKFKDLSPPRKNLDDLERDVLAVGQMIQNLRNSFFEMGITDQQTNLYATLIEYKQSKDLMLKKLHSLKRKVNNA